MSECVIDDGLLNGLAVCESLAQDRYFPSATYFLDAWRASLWLVEDRQDLLIEKGDPRSPGKENVAFQILTRPQRQLLQAHAP